MRLGPSLAILLTIGTAPIAAEVRGAPPKEVVRPEEVADTAAPAATAVDTTAMERAALPLPTQAESATPETLAVAPRASVPVFLGGRQVFRVQAARDGLDPLARAAAIRARLSAAVGRREVSADSVHLVSTPQGIEVRLADQFLWLITAADVEGQGGAELAAEVTELPAKVRDGILRERTGRRPIGILISMLIAIGITLATWFLVRLLLALNRRWRRWTAAALSRRFKGIRIRGFEVLSQAQIIGLTGGLLRRLDVVVGVLLSYLYLTLVLSLFPWTQGWSWRLFHLATSAMFDVARTVGGAVPGLVIVALILVSFRWLIGLSDRFFEAVASGSLAFGNFHPELAPPSKRIAKILLWIAALIVAYPYIPGAQSKAVQGVSILVGIMVSVGSTGFVGNVVSGIVLTYARSFRVGDRVRIGEHVGDVTSLGFFATKIRSIRNEEVTLPNGLVASSAITNYTRLAEAHGLILYTEVTIGYDAEWRTVHRLLVEAATRVEGIDREPMPWVNQRSLNDSHVSYEINCVTRLSHPQLRLYSDLNQEIQDAFARAGIEILSPAYHAIRDANAPVLPKEPAGPRSRPSGFRVGPRDS